MRKFKKMSFVELVKKNKSELLSDEKAIAEIEVRLDEKHNKRLRKSL